MGDDSSILHFEPPPTKVTRVRPQLSCIPCRQGKLKCNRQHPACDQCVKRSREAQCNYVPPPPKDRTRKAKDMRGRIRHLESLVVDLMNGKDPRALSLNPADPQSSSRRLPTPDQPSPEHHAASDGPKTHSSSGDDDLSFPSAFGALKISDEETMYMGGSHWMAVLNDIKEVKSFLEFEEEEEQESEKPDSEVDTELPHRYTLIVGSPKPLSKRELLQNLPPKAEVDKLVNVYLRGGDPTSIMFHEPTFRAEYERFWQNPSASPVIWIALIYGILCLATIFALRLPPSGPTPPSPEAVLKQAARFHNLCASAAVLGDFSRPKPYSLETVMLYAAAEYLSGTGGGGSPTDVWHIFGTVIRIALRMGYHRDPSHYGISPFHGEMRRRICWYYGSLTSHDFLLAAMLLCLEVNLSRETKIKQPESYSEGPFSSVEIFGALENATRIWESYEDSLIDASDTKKAAKAFRLILAKLKATPAEFEMQGSEVEISGHPQQYSHPPVLPSNGPGIAYLPTQTTAPVVTQGYSMAPQDPLEGMLEMPPIDINWDAWDKSVLPYDEYMHHEAQPWSMPPQPPNMGGPSAYPHGYPPNMAYHYQHQ
ncbi:hypothetical protein GTA08_BOTSDO09946 [Neofusicoccum parvum]|nr:hypothetical protein GTA08_BOTSDO09946 [Neofusicoccum parvum]